MHERARKIVEQIIEEIALGKTENSTGGAELFRVMLCGSTPEHTCDTPDKCAALRERLLALLETGGPPLVA